MADKGYREETVHEQIHVERNIGETDGINMDEHGGGFKIYI